MKKTLTTTATLLACLGSASASLWVDFNSNQATGGTATAGDPTAATAAKNEAGYQSYHVNHEGAGYVDPATTGSYATTFAVTGATTIGVTPDWPNTTDIRVRQSIGRSGANDASWLGGNVSLVTDWIGIDTRTGNGGNGDWDGTTGTPTYFTLTLSGLAAADYNWTSFHVDTENVHVNFSVEIDTGSGFVALADGSMTDSFDGGNPDSALDGSGLKATDFSSLNTYNAGFTADGTNDVVLRFAPYSGAVDPNVHNQLWGMNGFQLAQVPEPSTGLLGLLGAALLFRRRR